MADVTSEVLRDASADSLSPGERVRVGERESDFLSVSDASAPVKEHEHLARTKGFLSKL